MHKFNINDKYYINLVTAEDAFGFMLKGDTKYTKLILQNDGVMTLMYDSLAVRDAEYKKVRRIIATSSF